MSKIYRVHLRETYYIPGLDSTLYTNDTFFKKKEDAVSYMCTLFNNRQDYKTHYKPESEKRMVHIGNSYEEGFEGDWVGFDYIINEDDSNILVRICVIEEELN